MRLNSQGKVVVLTACFQGVLRLLVDQTAWDPNLGLRHVFKQILPRFQKDNLPFVKMREHKLISLHAMCEHFE